MTRPRGAAIWTHADGAKTECDTSTCVHCTGVTLLQEGEDMGGWCMRCMGHLCTACARDGRCRPFEQRVERAHARDQLLRAITGI